MKLRRRLRYGVATASTLVATCLLASAQSGPVMQLTSDTSSVSTSGTVSTTYQAPGGSFSVAGSSGGGSSGSGGSSTACQNDFNNLSSMGGNIYAYQLGNDLFTNDYGWTTYANMGNVSSTWTAYAHCGLALNPITNNAVVCSAPTGVASYPGIANLPSNYAGAEKCHYNLRLFVRNFFGGSDPGYVVNYTVPPVGCTIPYAATLSVNTNGSINFAPNQQWVLDLPVEYQPVFSPTASASVGSNLQCQSPTVEGASITLDAPPNDPSVSKEVIQEFAYANLSLQMSPVSAPTVTIPSGVTASIVDTSTGNSPLESSTCTYQSPGFIPQSQLPSYPPDQLSQYTLYFDSNNVCSITPDQAVVNAAINNNQVALQTSEVVDVSQTYDVTAYATTTYGINVTYYYRDGGQNTTTQTFPQQTSEIYQTQTTLSTSVDATATSSPVPVKYITGQSTFS